MGGVNKSHICLSIYVSFSSGQLDKLHAFFARPRRSSCPSAPPVKLDGLESIFKRFQCPQERWRISSCNKGYSVSMYVCMYVMYIYVCICTCTCIYNYTCMYILCIMCDVVCVCTYMYVYMCEYMNVHVQMYVCIYSMLIALLLEIFLRVKALGGGAYRY